MSDRDMRLARAADITSTNAICGACCRQIAGAAARAGMSVPLFSKGRMTRITPPFGWMSAPGGAQ